MPKKVINRYFNSRTFFSSDFSFKIVRMQHSSQEYNESMRFQREFWKIIYVISGHGEKIINDTKYSMSPGSLFIVHPNDKTTFNIKSELNVEKDELKIQQEIVLYNTSDSILENIYLHNWANSYKDRKTPLSIRFIEDFRKDLYFANQKDLGFSDIKNITINFNNIVYKELENKEDILQLFLDKPLKPKESTRINVTYILKIPNSKFTGYGKYNNGYRLRYWYLTPAIFDTEWKLYNNLDLDDLYMDYTDYNISFKVPKDFNLNTNLKSSYFVRWHCIQAILAQTIMIAFNSLAWGWTLAVILDKKEPTLYYGIYLFGVILFNIVEFFAVIITASKVGKGENVRWFLIANITDMLCSKKNKDPYRIY